MGQVIEFATNHPLLVGGFAVVLGLLVFTEVMRKLRGVKELSPALAVSWINDPDAVVIDVSPVADFNRGHIVRSDARAGRRQSLQQTTCARSEQPKSRC